MDYSTTLGNYSSVLTGDGVKFVITLNFGVPTILRLCRQLGFPEEGKEITLYCLICATLA